MTRFWRFQSMVLAGGMLAAGPLWWTRYEVVKGVNPVRFAEVVETEETPSSLMQHCPTRKEQGSLICG